MKKLSGKDSIIAFIVMMITAFAILDVFKVDDQDFWTQVLIIVGTAVFSGFFGILIGYACMYIQKKYFPKRSES